MLYLKLTGHDEVRCYTEANNIGNQTNLWDVT